jgi:hypothetical protein
MKLLKIAIVIIGLSALSVCIYGTLNNLNPDSCFCLYQIYQSGSRYELWWEGRTKTLEGTYDTLEQARAAKKEKCTELETFRNQTPKGENVQ